MKLLKRAQPAPLSRGFNGMANRPTST
ncbi:Protein of unknown function [Pyronema omphalodes CBS 100304]|uniref:Uncharacterized protein n=1 Tax=Pyronema omphalodes (strain CBS 100304) TaxID=1076935 RepID=U4LVW1_PYROM|nr:Protein of unknown function [Pyronema omphalodes CBS 100304]